MALIEWTRDLSVEIDALDDQHRQLVDIVNQYDDAIRRELEPRQINEVLNDLIGYTQEHFGYEENLLAEAHYPELRHHQDLHRQFLQKIERFQFDFVQGDTKVLQEIREYLKYWLISHIVMDDNNYIKHLKQISKTTV